MYNKIKKERVITPHDKAIKALNQAGYFLDRHGKKYDIYWNERLKRKIPLKRHDFNENDLKYIEKEIHRN